METLQGFYTRIRPPGFWGPVARACGEEARGIPGKLVFDVLATTVAVYGLLLGAGWLLLGRPLAGAAGVLSGAVLLWLVLRRPAS
jgi:hypothetical protein